MRIWLGLIFFLALSSCHRDLKLANEHWIELESEHFLLRTDVDESDAREAIVELEQTRSVFLRALAWGGEPVRSSRKFLIVELADLVEMHQFAPQEVAGFVATSWLGEQVVVIHGDIVPGEQLLLKHELAHAVARETLRRQPHWFAEGLAKFLEDTKKDPDAERDIIGTVNDQRVQWVAEHTAMPAAEMLRVESEGALTGNDLARFEDTAYEIFFVLFNQHTAGLAAYMKRLAHGDDPARAFAASFPGVTPEMLDQQAIDAQRIGVHYSKLGVTLEKYAGAIAVRALPPAEAHAQLGNLYSLNIGADGLQATRRRARDEFSQALKIDASNPEALLGTMSLEKMPLADRIARARAATEAHPDSWHAQVLLALVLGWQREGAKAAAKTDDMLAAIQAAMKLAPDEPYVLTMYARVLEDRGRDAEALPAAQHAVALDPSNGAALEALARALGNLDRAAEGLAYLQRAIEQVPERASKKQVAELLALKQSLELKANAAPAKPPN